MGRVQARIPVAASERQLRFVSMVKQARRHGAGRPARKIASAGSVPPRMAQASSLAQ
jgi:hypothetical protein